MEDRDKAQGEVPALSAVTRAAVRAAVLAILSDDHSYEAGLHKARTVAEGVLAALGPQGLIELVLALTSQLAAEIEEKASENGLLAADMAEIRFLD
ncbi:hypothetical protein ACQP04_23695 [Pseudonocardia halophobica]|uniref:hypothetical protein n=1 Tax=Pseudonocardia halophobica TaxID=29401 RepID=UPI003D8D8FFD